MKLRFIPFIFMVILFHGCKPLPNKGSSQNGTGFPTEVFWKLERFGGEDKTVSAENRNTIGFTLYRDNAISGFAGCNEFGGTYNFGSNNMIQFSSMMATKMYCEETQSVEREFFQVFSDASSYKIIGDRLEFLAVDETILAVFNKQILSSEEITDKYWRLKSIDDEPVEMAENQQREVYFKLRSEDNTVTGFTGCNTLFGSFNVGNDNRILFYHIAATLMACPEIDIKEAEFLKMLELTDSYTLMDDELTLIKSPDTILAVFEAVYFE